MKGIIKNFIFWMYRLLPEISKWWLLQKVYNIKNRMNYENQPLKKIRKNHQYVYTLKKLVNEFPDDPSILFAYSDYLANISDVEYFTIIKKYCHAHKKWMVNTKLDELEIEFIEEGTFIGAFGNHHNMYLLEAGHQLGIKKRKKVILLLHENLTLRSEALYEYFEPYLVTIRDSKIINEFMPLKIKFEGIGATSAGFCIFFDKQYVHSTYASNVIYSQAAIYNNERFALKLFAKHKKYGENILKKLGIPKDSWYVTLHIREPGYRGNEHNYTKNSDPFSYIKAIEYIVENGGYVFRMGDPSMTPMPSMKNLIDLANSDLRCSEMDVFLGATCKFCLGTDSGYIRVPQMFGVPVIMTNCTQNSIYYSLNEGDIYLPKKLYYKDSGDILSLKEMLMPPISIYKDESNDLLEDIGIACKENSSIDILDVTKEMYHKIFDPNKNKLNNYQKKFHKIANECGKNYEYPLNALATISNNFVKQYL